MLAREGSKGIPRKNLKPLLGKPLIHYTIKAVQESGIFDRFILSTDSQEIGDVAENYGVEVPFLRPKELAQDDSCALDAIEHALKWVEANDKRYDYVQYIFPTAPLRTAEDILNGIEILFGKNADMVISVCQTSHPAWWANILPSDYSLKGFVKPEFRRKNKQELPMTYRINGAIYVAKWDVFYEKKDWLEQETYAYIMPPERSIDIDSALDFKLAELLLEGRLT
jgi:N-acylneuraminate cytidylyltransferase/CMP-N,N'-diacetyllegionaminic acid synthase